MSSPPQIPVFGHRLLLQLLPTPPLPTSKTSSPSHQGRIRRRFHIWSRSLRARPNKLARDESAASTTPNNNTPSNSNKDRGDGFTTPVAAAPQPLEGSIGSPESVLDCERVDGVDQREADCKKRTTNSSTSDVDVIRKSASYVVSRNPPDVIMQSCPSLTIEDFDPLITSKDGSTLTHHPPGDPPDDPHKVTKATDLTSFPKNVLANLPSCFPASCRRSPTRRSSFFHAINSCTQEEDPVVSDAAKSKSLPLSPARVVSAQAKDKTTEERGHQQAMDQLFQLFTSTNAACTWDPELVCAVRGLELSGTLKGGWLVLGGTQQCLAYILHAYAHSLLHPPPGYTIANLGEVRGCFLSPPPKAQFTPLCPALCWVLHSMGGADVTLPQLQEGLSVHFPLLSTPDPVAIHAALSDLIRQRKVYHAGRGYSLVTPDTYGLIHSFPPPPPPPLSPLTPTFPSSPPPAPLLLPLSHLSISGAPLTNTAVQVDLADLLTQPPLAPLQADSLKRSSLRRLSSSKRSTPAGAVRVSCYKAPNRTDVTVTPEQGVSMLTKLLKVSSPRMATFSAQFPPPDWSDGQTRHCHSVATQTRYNQTPPEYFYSQQPSWAPRSSTLPRRSTRPLSAASIHDVSAASLPPQDWCTNGRISPSPQKPLAQPPQNSYSNPYQTIRTVPHNDGFPNNSPHGSPQKTVYKHLPHGSHPYIATPSHPQQQPQIIKTSSPRHIINGGGAAPPDVGLPPKHPPTQDFSHRRTLSASPRRVGSMMSQKPPPVSLQNSPAKHSLSKNHDTIRQRRLRQHKLQGDDSHGATTPAHQQVLHTTTEPSQSTSQPQTVLTALPQQMDDALQRDDRQRLNTNSSSLNKKQPNVVANNGLRTSNNDPNVAANNGLRTSNNDPNVAANNGLRTSNNDQKTIIKREEEPLDDVSRRLNGSTVSSSLDSGILLDPQSSSSVAGESGEVRTPLINRDTDDGVSEGGDHLNAFKNNTSNNKQNGKTNTISRAEKNNKKLFVSNQTLNRNGNADNNKPNKYSRPPPSLRQVVSPTKKKSIKAKQESPKKQCSVIKNADGSGGTERSSVGGSERSSGGALSPAESGSVRTYPSLSELNFSSLAAQKLLRGVSANSIDTLVEVNLKANSGHQTTKVKNTNFGYL